MTQSIELIYLKTLKRHQRKVSETHLNTASSTSSTDFRLKSVKGRNYSSWATCIVKFCFFGKNLLGPFIHITWYQLKCLKTSKGPLPGAFSFLIFFPKNPKFYKICSHSLIFGPTIKCYTISESSCLPCRRALLVINLVASTYEK